MAVIAWLNQITVVTKKHEKIVIDFPDYTKLGLQILMIDYSINYCK